MAATNLKSDHANPTQHHQHDSFLSTKTKHTDESSIMSASQTALQIPEILEQILLEMNTTDVLCNAMRVSHTWRNGIVSSIKIQQALFFVPVQAGPYDYDYSPLEYKESEPDWVDLHGNRISQKAIFFNEITFQLLNHQDYYDFIPRQYPPQDPRKEAQAFLDPTASWRRMLMTQPPIFSFGGEEETLPGEPHPGPSWEAYATADVPGLMVEDAMDVALWPRFGPVWREADVWLETLGKERPLREIWREIAPQMAGWRARRGELQREVVSGGTREDSVVEAEAEGVW